MDKIKEQIKTIKNNLFINDIGWRERSEENKQLSHKIRETIATTTKEFIPQKFIVDTLDFLDSHNL